MGKVLIINGNPKPESFSKALSQAYAEGYGSQAEVLHLVDLNFGLDLEFGYDQRTPWEADLQMAYDKIQEADHLVWVFPLWWYGLPARMKGFIDRIFLPGLTFEITADSPMPKGLLKGRTSDIIMTADSPYWYYRWWMGAPASRQFKKGTLEFCGVKVLKEVFIGPVKGSKDLKRHQWLEKVRRLGKKRAQKLPTASKKIMREAAGRKDTAFS
ncbi:NAD(P)H-dependent oxidoreductase [Persicobacter sp. CCB-QB2]|uniref:NAD(P)H-dependent oxidoreductase n=1 Tax=Persicobacter sp. CCB-QB2 TaxID=1561025 RepID=UPI0009E353E8|nr:NAD(P)H-dependent oxidoreductase [Persicobacter sp. CCB-QB2]